MNIDIFKKIITMAISQGWKALNPFTPKTVKAQKWGGKNPKFHFEDMEKQPVPYESTLN